MNLKIFNDVSEMHNVIRQKEKKFGLSRIGCWIFVAMDNKEKQRHKI